jgi:hypothetical protein
MQLFEAGCGSATGTVFIPETGVLLQHRLGRLSWALFDRMISRLICRYASARATVIRDVPSSRARAEILTGPPRRRRVLKT